MKAPFLRRIALLERRNRPAEFPFTLPFLALGRFELELTRAVTLFVGENGTGKSSLLEAIAHHCRFNAQGGSRDFRFGGESEGAGGRQLAEALRFSWNIKVPSGFFFRAESFSGLASYLDDVSPEADGPRALLRMSHGEALLSLFQHRFRADSRAIYVLDEPEAALSPERQLDLLRILDRMARSGNAQFLIATHSPLLMALPDAELFLLDARVKNVHFSDTPHFRIYSKFFEEPRLFTQDALSGSPKYITDTD